MNKATSNSIFGDSAIKPIHKINRLKLDDQNSQDMKLDFNYSRNHRQIATLDSCNWEMKQRRVREEFSMSVPNQVLTETIKK